MAHYAFLNENYIVTEVIVGKDYDGSTNWEEHYGNIRGQLCKQTSYNTIGGIHLKGGSPFRKNYAGIGFTYDPELDAFYPPKPFPSWILNKETCLWESPIPQPADGKRYMWNEEKVEWEEIPDSTENVNRIV